MSRSHPIALVNTNASLRHSLKFDGELIVTGASSPRCGAIKAGVSWDLVRSRAPDAGNRDAQG